MPLNSKASPLPATATHLFHFESDARLPCRRPHTVDSASINSSGVRGSQEAHGRACQSHHVLENKRVAVYEQQHGCGHLCVLRRLFQEAPTSSSCGIHVVSTCAATTCAQHMTQSANTEFMSHHGVRTLWADCNPGQKSAIRHCQKQHMTLYMRSAPARVNRVLPLRQHEKTQQLFRHNSNNMHLYKTGRLNLTSTMRERR